MTMTVTHLSFAQLDVIFGLYLYKAEDARGEAPEDLLAL
jgi:hypothetical protein